MMTSYTDPKIFECSRKTAYPLKSSAERDAALTTKQAGKLISAYQCRFCEKWHIGNDPANNKREEKYMAHKFFIEHDGLLLAKIKDEVNQYIFAIPPGTPENDQAVLEKGLLVAFKKGTDVYREKNNVKSDLYKIFYHIFPFYAKELVSFRQKTARHEEFMEELHKVKMDFLNGIYPPPLAERGGQTKIGPLSQSLGAQRKQEDQRKIAEQEMYFGRAVFRNEAGLRPHYRDIFKCCNEGCDERIELRAYISADKAGNLTSVGVRKPLDLKAIRKAGSNRQRPSWICGKCMAKVLVPNESLAESVSIPQVALPVEGHYELEVMDNRIMRDLERVTMDLTFDSAFVRGAMMMAFSLMETRAA